MPVLENFGESLSEEAWSRVSLCMSDYERGMVDGLARAAVRLVELGADELLVLALREERARVELEALQVEEEGGG